MRTYKAVCLDASPLLRHIAAPPLTLGKVYTLQDTGPTVLEYPHRQALPPTDPETVTVLDPDPEITHGRWVPCDPKSVGDKLGLTTAKLVDPYAVIETPRDPVRLLRTRFEVL